MSLLHSNRQAITVVSEQDGGRSHAIKQPQNTATGINKSDNGRNLFPIWIKNSVAKRRITMQATSVSQAPNHVYAPSTKDIASTAKNICFRLN